MAKKRVGLLRDDFTVYRTGVPWTMKLHLTPISSAHFTFSNIKGRKTFVTEASDLRGLNLLARLYDDAADAGFAMKSERTGQVAHFCFSRRLEGEETDGEFVADIFVPCEEDVRKFPGLAGCEVHVLND